MNATLTAGSVLADPAARLGDLRLNEVDEYGVSWYWETVEGWDSPASSVQVTQKASAHGAWLSQGYAGARQLDLGGYVVAPDAATARDAEVRLSTAVSFEPFVLEVTEHGLTRTCVVQRLGPVKWAYYGGTSHQAEWSVSLVAADPRKYGPEEMRSIDLAEPTTPGLIVPETGLQFDFTVPAGDARDSITVPNDGNTDAYPVFVVHGSLNVPRISRRDTGALMTANVSLGSLDSLEIDTLTHAVTLNDSASRRSRLVGDWITIPPGGAEIVFRAASFSPGAYLEIRTRSTWL